MEAHGAFIHLASFEEPSRKPPHKVPACIAWICNLASYGKSRPKRILVKARGLCDWLHSSFHRPAFLWEGPPCSPPRGVRKLRGFQNQQTRPPLTPRRAARVPRPAAAAGGLAPTGCRRRGLSLSDFAKSGVKDPQPPPHPPVDGGREARVLGPLIFLP